MNKLPIPEPFSGGILLSYKCNSNCKHCMYACSFRWENDWLSEDDAERILSQLSEKLYGKYPLPDKIGINYGIHFTGGEPFLNFNLLLRVVKTAHELDIPSTFVETNCSWCIDDEITREKLLKLKEAGLDGILISVNPFIIEKVPFERTDRCVKISREIFNDNVIIYQDYFYKQFQKFGIKHTLPFKEYLQKAPHGLYYMELFPTGRVPYKLDYLFKKYPAEYFFGESCENELIRDWHIHIDNYCNFIPGYCAGLSLGDARNLDSICEGIDLDEFPVFKALITDLKELYELGREFGYKEQREGYISKCHLCVDIIRHLAKFNEFKELKPKEFYEHLED